MDPKAFHPLAQVNPAATGRWSEHSVNYTRHWTEDDFEFARRISMMEQIRKLDTEADRNTAYELKALLYE